MESYQVLFSSGRCEVFQSLKEIKSSSRSKKENQRKMGSNERAYTVILRQTMGIHPSSSTITWDISSVTADRQDSDTFGELWLHGYRLRSSLIKTASSGSLRITSNLFEASCKRF